MSLIIDIETIPQDRETLTAKMPEEIKNPVMPLELREPEEPNWPEKCPAYSLPELTKKAEETGAISDTFPAADFGGDEKAADKAAAKHSAAWGKVREAEGKRAKWIDENRAKWESKLKGDRQRWELGIQEEKTRWIEEAALNANLGHAKLLGLRNTLTKLTRIFVWEPDKAFCKTIGAWFKSLPPVAEDAEARTFRDGALIVQFYLSEKGMLKDFFKTLAEELDPTGEDAAGSRLAAFTQATRPDVVTYYGNQFDFPFLFRRAWIAGVAEPAREYRRGRFFTDRFIDLHEEWTFGDRQQRSGGLDGLAQSLGYDGAKTQDGQAFHQWYLKDPVEGVVYLFNDLDMTEFCGRKMALIRDEKKV